MLRTVILILASASTVAQTADSALHIRAARQQLDAAFQHHDDKQSTTLFTPDCRFTAPSAHADGAKDLEHFYTSLFTRRPDVTLTHYVKAIAVNEPWDVASERGDWLERWTEKDGVTELRGTYLALWKREDGRWREYSEMIVPEVCTGSAYCSK